MDNNPSYQESEILKSIPYVFKYLPLPNNLGFGQANNFGLNIAKGDYIFFLNPDTILLNNAINILYNYIVNNPKCGACGGNLYDLENNPTLSYNLRFPGMFDEFDQAIRRVLSNFIDKGNTLFNHTGEPISVSYITGADLMIPKSVLNAIGAFNPAFFMYYEETELQYRIKKNGFEVWNVPEAKIIHLEGKSFSISRDRELRALTSRRVYYNLTKTLIGQKWMDIFYKTLTQGAYYFAILSKNNIMVNKLKQRLSVLNQVESISLRDIKKINPKK